MQTTSDLAKLSLANIRHFCAEESNRFFRKQAHDPRYCYELFRRAIIDQNERAWDAVYLQYRVLVGSWVERCPSFPITQEHKDFFVDRAFEKFWQAIPPAKLSQFADLKSLLRYLQICVNSAVTDYMRHKEHSTRMQEIGLESIRTRSSEKRTEDIAITKAQREQLWDLLEERFSSERERIAIYGTFVLGMKPRKLLAEFPHLFVDAREISRTKENVIARLRRDGKLLKILRDA